MADQGTSPDAGWLVVVAAGKECRAVLDGLGYPGEIPEVWVPLSVPLEQGVCEVLRTGVGKWSSAGAVGRWFDQDRHAGVLSIGVGGALPGSWLEIGQAVLADPSVHADEGILTPKGFLGLGGMGFAEDVEPVHPDPKSRGCLESLVDMVAPIGTVSLCSGLDAWASDTVRRTGAAVEAMEGAAVGATVRRIDPDARFAEVRVVSNTTGDRDRQRWDLDAGLAGLTRLMRPVLAALG